MLTISSSARAPPPILPSCAGRSVPTRKSLDVKIHDVEMGGQPRPAVSPGTRWNWPFADGTPSGQGEIHRLTGETAPRSAQQPRLDPRLGDGAVVLALDDVRR